MDRSQLDEATYLQQYGVSAGAEGVPAVLHPTSAAALSGGAPSCASCARLLRAREGSAAHLASVTHALELAEAEAAALRERYQSARHTAFQVWTAAKAAGVALDVEACGIAALAEDGEESEAGGGGPSSLPLSGGSRSSRVSSGSSGEQQPPAPAACTSEEALAAAAAAAPPLPPLLPTLDDVLCEGNGHLPSALLGGYAPHGLANTLCCAALLSAAPALGIATGSARGEVAFASLAHPGAAAAAAMGPSLHLPAPVLCLALRPSPGQQPTQLLAASLMDGSVHLLALSSASSSASASGVSSASLQQSLPKLHSKYATRVAWSGDGRVLASGAADGSLALLLLAQQQQLQPGCSGEEEVPEELRLQRLQHLTFSGGAVEALAWCCEQEGERRVDTLVVSVRGAASLFYLRLLWGEGRGEGGVAGGEVLPTLLTPCPLALRLYRAPLTEDCEAGDLSWYALCHGRGSSGGEGSGGGWGEAVATAGSSSGLTGGGSSSSSSASSSSSSSSSSPPLQVQHSHTILELAIDTPCASSTPGGPVPPPLLAAATEGGTVYVWRLGRYGRPVPGGLVRRMLGRLVGGPSAASAPRLAWQPRQGEGGGPALYLAATSQEGNSVELLSVGSGCRVRRLEGVGGGTIKGMAWAQGGVLVTCGYDKRVSVWGKRVAEEEEEGCA